MVKPITVRLNGRTQKVLSQIVRKGETYEQLTNYVLQSIDIKDWKNYEFWESIPEAQRDKVRQRLIKEYKRTKPKEKVKQE